MILKVKQEKNKSMREMMPSFQDSRLTGEPGGIIRWASPRCRFWCFSFLLAAPNVSQFCSALAENSFCSVHVAGHGLAAKEKHPSGLPKKARKDKYMSGKQFSAIGSVFFECLCAWRTSCPDLPLGGSSASQTCHHHHGTGADWTATFSADQSRVSFGFFAFFSVQLNSQDPKMEQRHCSWCISLRDKGWCAQGHQTRRNPVIVTDFQNWCGWKGLVFCFELGFHLLPYESLWRDQPVLEPGVWILICTCDCSPLLQPVQPQLSVISGKSEVLQLCSHLPSPSSPSFRLQSVNKKVCVCWSIVCCWCHRWWRHSPHLPTWQHGCSYFLSDEILSSGGNHMREGGIVLLSTTRKSKIRLKSWRTT